MSLPRTLGDLRSSSFSEKALLSRRVKDELRDNLTVKLRSGGPIFPGIVGYDDTVVPQIVNAVLSRHNFILLGLRGQAKSRILRALTSLSIPKCHTSRVARFMTILTRLFASAAAKKLPSTAMRSRLHI